MIPLLDYLFYKIYKFALFLKLDDSQFSALTGITILEILNIIILSKIFKFAISASKPVYWLSSLFLLLLNYLVFLRRRRYLIIKEKYDKESKLQRLIGTFLVILYITLSVLGLILYNFY